MEVREDTPPHPALRAGPSPAAAPVPAAAPPGATIQLGLIATPTLRADAVAALARELGALLARRYPDVRWEISHVRDGLVAPPASLTEIVDAARTRLLREVWDLAIVVTELPLRLAGRPLLTHASPTHGVALISLPALGVVGVRRRLRDAAADAVGVLIGDARPEADQRGGTQHERSAATAGETAGRSAATRRLYDRRRLVELAGDVEGTGAPGVAFVPRVIGANVRLLLGMIRANRPWRLATHLADALVAAIAAALFALITTDVWRIAASLGPLRLGVLTVAALTVSVTTLIAAHDLWERPADPRTREQVTLFNLVTVVTLALGIGSLCVAVFAVGLAAAGLLVDRSLLEQAVGRPVDLADYLRLAWLTSLLATVGGALGGALESHAAVREAAYGFRPDEQPAP